MQLDGIDRAILEKLRADGRATHAAIGRELSLSGPAVYARVKRLEETAVIRGYSISIDPAATGANLLAFIRVTTRPLQNETDDFESLASNDRRVLEVHDVDGEDSYFVKAACASTEDLRNLVADIRTLPQVLRTVTSIVLLTIKDGATV